MKPLLDVQELTIDVHTPRGTLTAVSDISFSIAPGETVCLVGESGSGKTIASKAIMRLTDYENGRIAGGSITLGETALQSLPASVMRGIRGKRIAMIFQEPMAAFDPVFTIGHQIAETMRAHRHGRGAKLWKEGAELLRRVGIPDPELRMKQYPGELSGGMLQRAMIAMALSGEPELLIADEPTTALDVTIQAQILDLLNELKDSLGMSILLITHDLGVAAEMADRIVVLYAGKIAEQGPASELLRSPRHPYTIGLLNSIAALDSRPGEPLRAIEGSPPGLSDMPSGCRFHPRCAFATDRCRESVPPLEELGGGRLAACWNRGEPAVLAAAGSIGGRRVPAAQAAAGRDTPAEQPPKPRLAALPGAPLEAAPALTSPLLEARDLVKHYPLGGGWGRPKRKVHAVDGVSLSIAEGETFGLVGESGSGKSTLGRLLLQLEPQTSGQVLYRGEELSLKDKARWRASRRDLQIIHQDPYGTVDPRWSIGDIIAEPLGVHTELSPSARRAKVGELLEQVGLSASWQNRYPHEFSGGQRQRIGIARAIAVNPRFILADEAVSALDVSVQAQIVNLLQDLQGRLGLTSVFIAHGLQVVRHISTRIGVMYLGKLVEIAPGEELFRSPAHPYTRALISSIPGSGAGVRESFSVRGEIPSPTSPPSGCRFHTRCPLATDLCRKQEPAFSEIGAARAVACHYPL
ncbi:ABC transporter ATP-binding protein [Saccharibacillus sp. CPCC 101409]|uniref:ABC transporter ATP-binding protein n=1 Tax=Saccharibacillus sp. CPCC 101409 TaxID=3058041 RepID=UPI002673393C|nr:ABC transporter ATP-binding protein [Saccharibacillus sp. CPCC 101409]MDO3413083.1 ABC transporter ATP-binding protein [Saccharibacillus sp. CPCC 101409]